MKRTRLIGTVALLFALLPPAAHAADRAAATGRIFARWDRPSSPGCAIGVAEHGRTVLERGYGQANLELSSPITPATVFDIGSTAKQFTAAAVLLLAQDGRLSLDDDVRRFIPELPDYGTPVSIRRMLNHTSGVRDYVSLLEFADVDPLDLSTERQALDMLARQKALNNAPGERFVYSNSNFFLASVMVERASGMSLREFADQRIFRPLGMTHTRFQDDHTSLITGRASGYSPANGEGWRLDETGWNEIGDGGLVTTVGDLMRWARNFQAPVVGGPDFAKRMTEVGALNEGRKLDYALGLMVGRHAGLTMIHHGGAAAGYRAELLMFPDRELAVAVLCNASSIDASELATQAADAWLGVKAPAGQAGPAATTALPALPAPDAWAGVYRSRDSGVIRTVDAKDGKASIVTFGGRYGLRPTGPDAAELVDGPIAASYRFTDGTMVQTALGGEAAFDRLVLAHPSPAEMAAYAGRYDCPELDRIFRFEVVDGRLTRRDPRGEDWRFDALDRDAFGYGNLTVRFGRDGSGRVDGATLDIGRARGMSCRRVEG